MRAGLAKSGMWSDSKVEHRVQGTALPFPHELDTLAPLVPLCIRLYIYITRLLKLARSIGHCVTLRLNNKA